jgi:hypothetical protein
MAVTESSPKFRQEGAGCIGRRKTGCCPILGQCKLEILCRLAFPPFNPLFQIGTPKNRLQSAVSAIFAMSLFQNGTKRAEPGRGNSLKSSMDNDFEICSIFGI